MHVTLRQLEAFLASSKCMNFSQTAKALHLSQPAVSQLIKQLEEQCGNPITERINHEIHLTKTGELLVKHSKRVLHEVNLLKDNVLITSQQGYGKITISVHNLFQVLILDVLSEFYKKFPYVELEILADSRENQLKQLDKNEADLYLLGPIPNRNDLIQTHCFTTQMIMVASPSHYLTRKKQINAEQLTDETILTTESCTTVYKTLNENLSNWKLKYKAIKINNNYTIKQAVKSGLGIALLPYISLRHDLEQGNLKKLDIINLDSKIEIYLIHHKEKILSPTMVKLKESILNCFKASK